jgi:ribosomal protein S18 acetylase RimI-like enzyme
MSLLPALATFKPVTTADIELLANISRETFFAAFAHLNNADDMEAYAAASFTHQQLRKELNTPGAKFIFAMLDAEVVGFMKLNTGTAQNEFKDMNSLEIERLYVLSAYQGRQIGRQMLKFALAWALTYHHDFIWLGVWEHNRNAIRLYERMGFSLCGSHDFMLGNDKQTDVLMKKLLK